MFKKMIIAIVVIISMAVAAPRMASADWGHGHHHHHHGHWHGHHHGHWHGHGHWQRPVVYPPIVIGGYYPARYYYADPYWYGGYPAYYRSGVQVSFGW